MLIVDIHVRLHFFTYIFSLEFSSFSVCFFLFVSFTSIFHFSFLFPLFCIPFHFLFICFLLLLSFFPLCLFLLLYLIDCFLLSFLFICFILHCLFSFDVSLFLSLHSVSFFLFNLFLFPLSYISVLYLYLYIFLVFLRSFFQLYILVYYTSMHMYKCKDKCIYFYVSTFVSLYCVYVCICIITFFYPSLSLPYTYQCFSFRFLNIYPHDYVSLPLHIQNTHICKEHTTLLVHICCALK